MRYNDPTVTTDEELAALSPTECELTPYGLTVPIEVPPMATPVGG